MQKMGLTPPSRGGLEVTGAENSSPSNLWTTVLSSSCLPGFLCSTLFGCLPPGLPPRLPSPSTPILCGTLWVRASLTYESYLSTVSDARASPSSPPCPSLREQICHTCRLTVFLLHPSLPANLKQANCSAASGHCSDVTHEHLSGIT